MGVPTPSQEDYLKTIWLLIQRKGYARVADIAETLGVRSASVSRMVRRLHEEGLTTYEPYRGLNLTHKGSARGRLLVQRQEVLRTWLGTLGVTDSEVLDRTVEAIEHYIGPDLLVHIERLLAFIEAHPAWWQTYAAQAAQGELRAGAHAHGARSEAGPRTPARPKAEPRRAGSIAHKPQPGDDGEGTDGANPSF